MRHCCSFRADDIYFLNDSDLYSSRRLSIGFCPICSKPVAELIQWRFDGKYEKISLAGIKANDLVEKHKKEISHSMRQINYARCKAKPFGWVYGINKSTKNDKVRQYACDFYGNKELIKSF